MDANRELQERSMTGQSTVHETSPTQSLAAPNSESMAPDSLGMQMLIEEVRRLRQQVEEQSYRLPPPTAILQDSGEAETSWTIPSSPIPLMSDVSPIPMGATLWNADKDLYRLAKMVKCITFEPKDEKEYEDALDEWESKARGCGIHFEIVKNLLVHVGALKVRQAAAQLPISSLEWSEVKNRVARILFPFSRYRRDLEKEIEEESRTSSVEDTLALLAKYRKRHADLCLRWRQTNTLSDDRMKDALLAKLPADKITPCLSVKDFHTFTYDEFAYHCRMIVAALDAGAKTVKKFIPRVSHRSVSNPVVNSIHVAAVEEKPKVIVPKKPAPPDYVCFNCGEKGHFAKGCPYPKVKCESCGRLGHKAASCTKLRHDGPMGRTRTGFLRMTRGGIHLDLIDEATKRALFDSMRKHLETQEVAYEKSRLKAQAKRDQKKSEETQEETVAMETEDNDLLLTEPLEKVRKLQEISQATFVDSEKCVESHFLDVEIFGRMYPSLLDSGAVVSLLPENIWNDLPPENKEAIAKCDPGEQPLMGLGGSFKVKTIIDLPIVVEGRALVQRFFVSPAPSMLILGMDALTNLEIQIDYATQEITLPNHKKTSGTSEPMGISKLCMAITDVTDSECPPLHFGEGATESEKRLATELIKSFPETWKNPIFGTCTSATHCIDTGTAKPIRQRVRRLPPEKIQEVRSQISNLLEKGAIQRSNSPWASAIVLVPKANGTTRLCVDYRALNEVTKKDAFPLPSITELLDRLSGSIIFSTLDLAAGFHQIPMDEESRPKTAFITPEGLYEFLVMPFGLANAPSTFQRMTDALFKDPPLNRNVSVYIDDIVIFTKDVDQHFQILREVFNKLKEVHLFVNLEKTVLFARKAKYLGFIVQKGIVTPDSKQIAAIQNLQPPTDVPSLRRFLGLTGYFRHFIPNFSNKVLPLTKLLKKGTPYEWGSTTEEAWKNLKEELAGEVCLKLPEVGKMYTLDTDASDYALGAVLLQEDEEKNLRPIAYASRTLSGAERNWTTREKEAYAIVWAILHFSPYLRAQPHFLVRTDHQSLKWLWKTENKRITRWTLLLQEYNFTIQHIKGAHHQHADIFSRDVTPDEQGDKEVERIATPLSVFTLQSNGEKPILNVFPTFDDILDAQKEECTSEFAETLKLRKGNQDVWESMGGQVYVPTKLRVPIMYYFHYGKSGAHQGVNRSFSRIRKYFYWPGLKDDLQAYHSHCLTCARRRPKPLVGNRGHLLAAHVGGVVALDVVGPIKMFDETGHFLTIIDHFTRYPHVVYLDEVTTATVWKAIYEQWIAYFGVPSYFLTDNATIFKSNTFVQAVKEIGAKNLYSFPYHPQGNGIVESFHIYLKKALVASLRTTTHSLSTILAEILSAYRATPHPSTGESPFYLLTGMDMITPYMQEWSVNYVEEYGYDRAEWIQMLRDEAFDTTARKAITRKENQRSDLKSEDLQPGSLVLYWLHPQEVSRTIKTTIGGAKMKPLWSPPCRIIRKLTTRENTYLVRSLWHIGKPRVIPREELLEIKGAWTHEEAQTALKELMADIQKVRFQQDVAAEEEIKETSMPRERHKDITPPDLFIQQLTGKTAEATVHHEGEIPISEDKLVSEAFTETPRPKRPRTISYITWQQFGALLTSPSSGL